MTTLADLFDDTRVVEPAEESDRTAVSRGLDALLGGSRGVVDDVRRDVAADGAAASGRLDRLLGGPRSVVDDVRRDDTAQLTALVDAAVRNPGPATPVERVEPNASKRGFRRRDWTNIVTAIIAVFAVVAVAVVGVIALASASPAAGAARALSADEASLANDRQALSGAIDRAQQLLDDGHQQAADLGVALAAVTGISDEPTRLAAEQARVGYIAALDAVDLPDMPSAYRRGDVDLDSLAEVGAAIDSVRTHRDGITSATADIRELRQQIAGLSDGLKVAMTAFGATLSASAEQINTANPDARQQFRDAVAVTAGIVVAELQQGGLGTGPLSSYAAAVQALRDDQVRAIAAFEAEQAAREEAARERAAREQAAREQEEWQPPQQPSVPQPQPEPQPQPQPEPQPEPEPEPPADPEPVPAASGDALAG